MINNASNLPTGFFSSKSLFTLSGSAGAVWLFCLVLSNIVPPNLLSVYIFRLIAISCSELLAIGIILPSKPDSLQKWLVGIFNGLLIFINASGINAVSTGLAFANKNELKQNKVSYHINSSPAFASFFPFKREVNWWPDKKQLEEKAELKKEIETLKKANGELITSYDSLKSNCDLKKSNLVPQASYISQLQTQKKLLLSQITKLQDEIAELKKQPAAKESKSAVSGEKNEPLSDLNRRLSDCEKDNMELTKKLTKIKNYKELLKDADKYNN